MRDSACVQCVAVRMWCEYIQMCTSDARMPRACVHLSTCLSVYYEHVCAVAFVCSWCGVRVCVTCGYCTGVEPYLLRYPCVYMCLLVCVYLCVCACVTCVRWLCMRCSLCLGDQFSVTCKL